MLQHQEQVAGASARPDDGAALLAAAFPGMTVQVDDGEGPLSVHHTAARAGAMRIAELRVRGAATLSGTSAPGVVVAGVLVSGRLDVGYARHRLDTSRPFLRPAEPAAIRLQDARVRFVEFEAEAFRVAAERLGDRAGQRLRLLRTRPVNDEAAEAWRWTAAHLVDALLTASSPNALVREELFEFGVRMLLAGFGEPVTHAAGDVRAAPAAVRRAVAYLEEHAAGTVTVPAVAAAARVSPRSLQALFRRHLGVTPLAHLHAIRLDAARRDLLAGGAAPATVHEIATRWGFGNSGRFARLYADRFGERPSDTLRLG